MLAALKPLLTSKKFLTALFTVIANAALRLGWELDVEVALAITSPLIAYILGQSAVDVKKAGLAGLLLIVVACSGAKGAAGRVAGDVVDCLTPSAKDAIGTFGPAMADVLRNATSNDGKVDWEPVKSVGRSLKTPAAQCVLAAVVAEALRPKPIDPNAPMSAPLQVDPAELLGGFDALRHELYGGTRYQFGAGVL